MKARRIRKGFSLLELIAVITLIGIVAAVAMYRLNGVNKDAAGDKVASENVALIQSAVERYAFDNGGSFPADTAALVSGGYLATDPNDNPPHSGGSFSIDGSGKVTYTK